VPVLHQGAPQHRQQSLQIVVHHRFLPLKKLKMMFTLTKNEIQLKFVKMCFVHPIFRFLFLVTFGDEVTIIRKYYVIFVYILQGKMGKTDKSRKENRATKVTKIPKTKRRKYGMNETKMMKH